MPLRLVVAEHRRLTLAAVGMGADHDSDEHGEETDGGEDPSWECPSSSVPAAVEGRERGREHVSSLEAYARRARSRVTSWTTVDAYLHLKKKSVGLLDRPFSPSAEICVRRAHT